MDEDVVASAIAHWGFGHVPCHLIAERENRVYRIDKLDEPVAMRLHRPGLRTPDELISELHWMAMLAESTVSAPVPVLASDGRYFAQFDDTFVDVVSWLDGTPLANSATIENFTRLGSLMAKTHDLADQWMLPAGFTRPHWDIPGLVGDQPLWGPFWENPTLSKAQTRQFENFRDHARATLAGLGNTLDFGLIHADLVPENVLVSGDAMHLIDFDDGGIGFRLFDLATVTHRSRRTDPAGNLARAFLNGYQRHRALDVTHLPLFEAVRACSYVGWITPRLAEAGAKNRNTRFISEALASIVHIRPDQKSRTL